MPNKLLPNINWALYPPLAQAHAAWQLFLDWDIHKSHLPTKELDQAAKTLADVFATEGLPFRLPSLHEKLKESELTTYFDAAPINALHCHEKIKHDLIGNFFKPSALQAAISGQSGNGLKDFWINRLDQGFDLLDIKPVNFRELDDHYYSLKLAVIQSLSDAVTAGSISPANRDKALRTIRENWRPDGIDLPTEAGLIKILTSNKAIIRPKSFPSTGLPS